VKQLNKDIYEKAEALNQWILDQEIVKEFQKYEKMIQEHAELHELEEELKQDQQDIVNLKHQGKECQTLIESYQRKKKQFDEHPIVYNYLMYKAEVNELIHQIQEDINEQLKKKID